MTGASYAGKYIPLFTNGLLASNESMGKTKFDIASLQMGDPFTEPLSQRLIAYKIARGLNLFDESDLPQVAALNKSCIENVTKWN